MTTIKRINCNARAASLVISGSQVETSGLVATVDDALDIRTQTGLVLEQAEKLFKVAGLSKANITRVQIWLANMDNFSAMNEVYDAWVDKNNLPVRACVGAALADDRYLIEIQVFGYAEI